MIIEFLKYLFNPVPIYIRKFGYLKESIAIEARYNRNKSAWTNHLEQTKNFIITSSDSLPQRRKAVVIGSGSLYDLPIEYLSKNFNEVICVDIIHLRSSKNILKKFKNFSLIEKDILGVSERLYNNYLSGSNKLPTARHEFSFLEKDVDMVISLNLLSQLPLMPKAFIEENFEVAENGLNDYCRNLIKAHLEFLKRLSCKSVLITETSREFISKSNKLIKSENTLFGIEIDNPANKWNWEVAPIGEYSNKYSIKNKISAYHSINFKIP